MSAARLAWARTAKQWLRRDETVGALVLLLLVNVTFFPFLWGSASLRDSIAMSSIFESGSRSPAAVDWHVPRELDPGAPSDQTEPWFALEHRIVADERVAPLWNPYSGFGTPLAANMQSQPYSPFAWIAIASPAPRAYNLFIAARIYAAGLGAFLFLLLFVGLVPALAGGAAFMYSGYFWLFLTMPEVSVEVWLPTLLYGVERVVRRSSMARVGFLALVLACAVFGGMPESLMLAVVLTTAYALVRTLGVADVRRRLPATIAALAGAALLALGLSAIVLLPFFEYLPLSANGHSGTFIGTYADSPERVADFYLAPLMHGAALNGGNSLFPPGPSIRGFFGCAVTFFALLAVASRFGDALRRKASTLPIAFFAAAASLCFAKRFGLLGVNWIGTLPLLRLVIFPKYEEALLACAVSLLAGFGVAAMIEKRLSTATCAAVASLPLLGLTLAARGVFTFATTTRAEYESYRAFALTCSLVFLGGALIVALATRMRFTNGIAAGIAAFVLIVLEPQVSYIVPTFYRTDPPPSLDADTLAGAPYLRFLETRMGDGARFLGRDAVLYPNWSAAFSVRDVRNLDALYDWHYLPFLQAFLAPSSSPVEDVLDRYVGVAPQDFGSSQVRRFLQLSSIRYIAAARKNELDGLNYRLVFTSPPVSIFEYKHPLPRLSVYRHVMVADNDPAALELLRSPAFDPGFEAIVRNDPTDPGIVALAKTARSPVLQGRLIVDRSRDVEASIDVPSRALVVLNDMMYDGWTASVDGRPTVIRRTNYLFRGVVVNAGKHVLRFFYEPASYTVGRNIGLLALSTVFGMLLARPAMTWIRRTRSEGI